MWLFPPTIPKIIMDNRKDMNSQQPLVTILINNYNYSNYIAEAIESALNQTYPNTEVIVVDDGSTDNSREIIANYKDTIIPLYKENGGQASAINAGFALSKGQIVCLLDSDDVWMPEKVAKVVEMFNTYPKVAVVYHKVKNIDVARKEFGIPWPPYKPIRGNIAQKVAKTGGWWPFPPSTGLSFSREFLSKVMNVPEQEYRICADTYLADLSPFCGDVVGIEEALSLYRVHGSNNWSNNTEEDAHTNRILQYHETRASVLNRMLQNLGMNLKVSLAHHWPYQMIQYKQGKRKSLLSLTMLAVQNPWEPRLSSKLKTLTLLWFGGRTGARI